VPLLCRRARGAQRGRRRARHTAGTTPQGDSRRGTSGRAASGRTAASGRRAWTQKSRVAGGLRPGRRDVAARRRFQRERFDLGYFDQVFLPKFELKCI
jgi:hypothetical protein